MCYTGTFRYQDSKLDEIRSVFFESLMNILKIMHHYISPNWNARGEWAECPDMEAFKTHLSANGIEYADYGTAFAAEWHQIFFYDPEGNIIEVHQQVV